MSTKVIHILICDRCEEEFTRRPTVYVGDRVTISKLSYMFLKNGSDSSHSDMALDMCHTCTDEFKAFWKAGKLV